MAYDYPDVTIDSYYYQHLEIKTTNYILVWNFNDHLFVLAVFRGQGYLANGVDNCHINSRVRGMVRRLVSREISLGSVGRQQSGDDHCGSSAVSIALGYSRMMKGGEIGERLLFPVGIKRKFVQKLHPNKTVGRGGEPSQIRHNVNDVVCRFCQASYRKKDGKRLKTHDAKCKGRPLY